MEEQVNLTLRLPERHATAILISDPKLRFETVNILEADTPAFLTNKIITSDTNTIVSNGLSVAGVPMTIQSNGAVPGTVLTYVGGDTLEFLPSSGPGSVVSVNGQVGAVLLTKNDVGLGNVDNTSDLLKPVSVATQNELNLKMNLTDIDVLVPGLGLDGKIPSGFLPNSIIAGLIFQGPWDIPGNNPVIPAAAPGNQGWYYIVSVPGNSNITGATLSYVIGDWLISNGVSWSRIQNSQDVISVNGQTGAVLLNKADVGLGNVDNTSDLLKPVSIATQAALSTKISTSNIENSLTSSDPSRVLGASQGLILDQIKVNYTDIENSLTSASISRALSAAQGLLLNQTKIPVNNIDNNLLGTDITHVLGSTQGPILVNMIDSKVSSANIDNNLLGTDPTHVLGAPQGLLLNQIKLDKSDVINNVTTNSTTQALSAAQGLVLNQNKIAVTSIENSLTSNDPLRVLSAAQGTVLKSLVDGKVSIGSIENSLTSTDPLRVLSAAQGTILEQTKISTSNIENTLTGTDPTFVLSALQGTILEQTKLDKADVINNLITNNTTQALSAAQGFVLNQGKLDKADVINNLVTNDSTKALSAAQGLLLDQSKIPVTSIENSLTSNNPSRVLSAAQGLILNQGKLDKSDVINNLVTNTSTQALSAAQGLALNQSKLGQSSIENSLTSQDPLKVLGASQGYLLDQNKLAKTDVINNLVTNTTNQALSAAQGLLLNQTKLDKVDVINNLITNDATKALSAAQGLLLDQSKIPFTNIENSLTSSSTTRVLSAAQGLALDQSKIAVSNIDNNLLGTNPTHVLGSTQGLLLNQIKLDKTDVINNLTTNTSTQALSAAQGLALNQAKLDKVDVINNLVTNDATKALSAAQGLVLNQSKIPFTNIENSLTSTDPLRVLSAAQGPAINERLNTLSYSLINCSDYQFFDDLFFAINSSPGQTVFLKTTGSTSIVGPGLFSTSKSLIVLPGSSLTLQGAYTPDQTVTIIRGLWDQVQAYASSDVVIYRDGRSYSAISNIPANTPWNFALWTALPNRPAGTPMNSPFNPASSYSAGFIVDYDGQLYYANSALSPGAFNPANWTLISTTLSLGSFSASQGLIVELGSALNVQSSSNLSGVYFINSSLEITGENTIVQGCLFSIYLEGIGPGSKVISVYGQNNQILSSTFDVNVFWPTLRTILIGSASNNTTIDSCYLNNDGNYYENHILCQGPMNNVYLSRNTLTGAMSTQVFIDQVTGLSLVNNKLDPVGSPFDSYCLRVTASTGIKIQGNTFIACPYYGLSLSGSSGTFDGNNVSISGTRAAFSWSSSTDYSVLNNSFTSSGVTTQIVQMSGTKRGQICNNFVNTTGSTNVFFDILGTDRDITFFNNHWRGTYSNVVPNTLPTDPSFLSSLNSAWQN